MRPARRIFLLALGTLLLVPGAAYCQQMMKAVRIHGFGGPEVLVMEEVPRPQPGAGELLVRVHAAAVNPVDTGMRRRGMMGTGLPYTPGFDVSGVVESVGAGVTRFRPGDEVFAMISLRRGGGYADFAIVLEPEASRKPTEATHAEAAAVPLVALTAWQALFETADLQEGQTVLIHAGAGGVGSVAVQLAKWKGATVIATASPRNHEFLRSIGADVVVDYNTRRFEEFASGVDVVLDPIGGETQVRSLSVLKEGGILVSIVGLSPAARSPGRDVRTVGILVQPDGTSLQQIADLIDEGYLKPVVTHIFSLEEAPEAHRQSETRHTRGKIVFQIIPPR